MKQTKEKGVKRLMRLALVAVVVFAAVMSIRLSKMTQVYADVVNSYWLNTDGWYVRQETLVKLEAAPEEITEMDELVISGILGAEDRAYLAGAAIKGIGRLAIAISDEEDEVVIGSAKNPVAYVGDISATNGKVTVYAEQTGFVRGWNGGITVYGDVSWLDLGSNPVNTHSGPVYDADIVINGSVMNYVYFNHQAGEDGGFVGNVTVSGTVAAGTILVAEMNPTTDANEARTTHTIDACEAGVFQITAGVLSDKVPVTALENDESQYRNEYQLYSSGLQKFVFDGSGSLIRVEDAELADIPEGAELSVYGTDGKIELVKNLSELSVMAGDFTLVGNTEELVIYPNTMQTPINLVIKGNVAVMDVQMFRPNPEINITVTGTVTNGTWNEIRRDMFNTRGYFSGLTNMDILSHSEWNKDIMMTLPGGSSWGYQAVGSSDVKDATGDDTIGAEISVNGSTTILKVADTELSDSTSETLSGLVQTEEFKDTLEDAVGNREAESVFAVDISVTAHYVDTETGLDYEDEKYGQEVFAELEKELPLKLQIPEEQFDETAEYLVIREHEGKTEVLETKQNGKELSFASDKFSTFVVVKAEKAKEQPLEVKNVAAAAGDGKVTLSWDAVSGAELYAVFLKRTNGEVVLVDNRVTKASYEVNGLANGTKVGFVVKAYRNGVWSDWSATAWVTPTAPKAVAPENVSVIAGDGCATVSWDAVPGAQLYAIFLKRTNGEVVLIDNRVTATTYSVPGLANGTTVGFVVKSYVGKQWSGWSSVAWATPQIPVVPPTGVMAAAGNGSVTVSWDAVPGAQTYAIFLKRTNGEVVLVHNRVSGTSYTVNGLANGTKVGFVVKAYIPKTWSTWSATAWATPSAEK